MNCKQIKNKIIPYIDSELSENETHSFDSHINNCVSCSALFENISKTMNSFENNNNLPDDFYFYTRLKQKIENKYNYQTPVYKKILQTAVMSCLLLIGGYMGIYIGNQYKANNYTAEENRAQQIRNYAEENYLTEMNTDKFESLFTTNQ